MALAGSFASFSVLEIATWLEAVGRPGCLVAELPAGDVCVWFGDGGIVGARTAARSSSEPTSALFEVIRSGPVTWHFQSSATPAQASAPVKVATCAAAMHELVAEWDELTTLVPFIDGEIALVEQPPGDIVLDAARWDAVRRLAAGPSSVAAMFGGDEVEARRRAADLVRAGIAVITVNRDPVKTFQVASY